MSRHLSVGVLALALVLPGCTSHKPAEVSNSPNRLTSASVTFTSLQDGKDEKSAVSVQLLRKGSELAADATSSGTKFNDNAPAAPIALAVKGPFTKDDTEAGSLRLHLTPDGDDTWTFNVRLSLRYADETEQNFAWPSVRLDEKAPDRNLVLSGARQ
jgi:hypothetical protein